VVVDRSRAEEQLRSDLLVGRTPGHEPGDLPFLGGELVAELGAEVRGLAGGAQLGRRALGPGPGAEAFERVQRDSGLTALDRAEAAADVPRLAALPDVQGRPSGPAPSPDGRALQTMVTVDLGANGWKRAADVTERMREIVGDGAPGLAVHVTGPLGFAADSADAFDGIDSTLRYATIAVVVGILLITYRSPVLWILPVLSAGAALTVAQATVYVLARHAGLTVTAQSAGILTVLVMGAATDYALLLTARYREELRRHVDRRTAMAVALRRAAPAAPLRSTSTCSARPGTTGR
jgi:RND superfamily putative drug exporter